jgi:hypothetical protein
MVPRIPEILFMSVILRKTGAKVAGNICLTFFVKKNYATNKLKKTEYLS